MWASNFELFGQFVRGEFEFWLNCQLLLALQWFLFLPRPTTWQVKEFISAIPEKMFTTYANLKLKAAKFDSFEINSLQKKNWADGLEFFFSTLKQPAVVYMFPRNENSASHFVITSSIRPSCTMFSYSLKSVLFFLSLSLTSTQSYCQNPARGTDTNQRWTERRGSHVFVVLLSVTHFAQTTQLVLMQFRKSSFAGIRCTCIFFPNGSIKTPLKTFYLPSTSCG